MRNVRRTALHYVQDTAQRGSGTGSRPKRSGRWQNCPSTVQQTAWTRLTEEREPRVKGVWGFVDGKNYRILAPSNQDLQNAAYNGWLHAVMVTGTLCFGVDGTIVWGQPGSWNDGETSRQLQLKLSDEHITLRGTGIVAPEASRLGMVAQSSAITSLRQAAKWGMGAASKCYRILQLPLPYDPVQPGRRLEIIMRLYNFRVRQSGISQIRSVFGISEG